jgi:hypothetical protein
MAQSLPTVILTDMDGPRQLRARRFASDSEGF